VLPAFHDPRYVRVDGKPLFFVYRPTDLPDAGAFADQWRGLAERAGLPGLYLIGETKSGWTAAASGFDAELTVPLYAAARRRINGPVGARIERWRLRPRRVPYSSIPDPPRATLPNPQLPVVLSNWDNTPRFGNRGFVLSGATPEAFGRSLRSAVHAVRDLPAEQRIVLLKSWNEWAEGNYVEPDRTHGTAYLEQVAAAVSGPVHERVGGPAAELPR
jgi:hypothetical protein